MAKRTQSRKLKIKSLVVGITTALIIFLVFGIVTVLISNRFFIRMTPVHWYDYAFLISTSLLSGVYAGLWYYKKNNNISINNKCNYTAGGGIVTGLFSFGCAICNKLLVFLLGLSGVMSYFMPIQPILGVLSIGLLSFAVYTLYKSLQNSTAIN